MALIGADAAVPLGNRGATSSACRRNDDRVMGQGGGGSDEARVPVKIVKSSDAFKQNTEGVASEADEITLRRYIEDDAGKSIMGDQRS